jgi:hypothetical protein
LASTAQLMLDILEEPTPTTSVRGPKGARVGDIVVAEGSRWSVEALDPDRREAVCRLIGGSEALRRFRARRILKVEKRRR